MMNAIRSAYADDEIVTYAELRQNLKKVFKKLMNFALFNIQWSSLYVVACFLNFVAFVLHSLPPGYATLHWERAHTNCC